MLQLSSRLMNVPVISLRTGGQVGVAVQPIINPNNLKIEGWYVIDQFSNEQLVLPTSEVRERSRHGLAVNDHDAMTDPNELVRMQKVLRVNFQLMDKTVKTDTGKKIGKISDYSFDSDSLYVQKLYVNGRGLKAALMSDERVIGRSQIVRITDKEIIVRDTLNKIDFKAPVPIPDPQQNPALS